MTKATTVLCSMLIVAVPALFGVIPAVGLAVTRSRWAAVAWVLAAGAAATAYVLNIKGLLPDQRTLVVLLSPLYQLASYTLLLSFFMTIFRDRPRYTPLLFIDNYIKFARSLRRGGPGDFGAQLGPSYVRDSVFKIIVILTGVVPPLYYMYSDAII